MQTHIIGQFWQEGVISLGLALMGGLVMWPVKKVSKAYKELMEAVQSTHAELIVQRTNCLQTLSNQGNRQVELLEKMNNTLTDMHLDQRGLMGKLDK